MLQRKKTRCCDLRASSDMPMPRSTTLSRTKMSCIWAIQLHVVELLQGDLDLLGVFSRTLGFNWTKQFCPFFSCSQHKESPPQGQNILHHLASSCIILHHLASSCIILHPLASSFITFQHFSPSFTVFHRLSPSFIVFHHLLSSFIIVHHISSYFIIFIIFHLVASSCIILHHRSSSFIMFHRLSSSCIIFHHLSSSFIIFHHPSSSFIIFHHLSSSFIIFHHRSSYFIIFHHLSSSFAYFIRFCRNEWLPLASEWVTRCLPSLGGLRFRPSCCRSGSTCNRQASPQSCKAGCVFQHFPTFSTWFDHSRIRWWWNDVWNLETNNNSNGTAWWMKVLVWDCWIMKTAWVLENADKTQNNDHVW